MISSRGLSTSTVAALLLSLAQGAFAQDSASDPPAAPVGFSAYPRPSYSWSVELYWIPNSEPDLDHYELDITGDPCESLKEVYCGLFVVPGSDSTFVFNNQNLVHFYWYQFRLRAVNTEGVAGPWSQTIILSSTDTRDETVRPKPGLALNHYPNPFNASTRIDFTLDSAGAVTLCVFDVLGRRVRMLIEGAYPAGVHSVFWPGTDEDERALASGVYFLALSAHGANRTSRLLLLK